MLFVVLVAIILSVVALYLYNSRHFSKWKKLGIPGPTPSYIFGNMSDATFLKKTIADLYARIYRKFENEPYIGIFIIRRPAILVRDPEILKDILVKDFYSFHDNDLDVDKKVDPIFANNPFTVKGENWKIIRSRHSPHFTNSKNKVMYPMIEDVGNRTVRYLNHEIEKGGGQFCMDGLETAARFTTDVVAACSMGIDAKSFGDADLREAGRKIFNPDFLNSLKLYFLFILPSIAKYLSVRLIPKEVYEKYRGLVIETLKYRKENNVVRNDFLDAIKERKGVASTIEEMTDQVGGFFIDGFGTSSFGMSFMLLELAANTDVQSKLRKEVDEVISKHDDKFTLDALQEMPYLDAVISESLRKYPPLAHFTKLCTKPYTLPALHDSAPLNIEVGTPLVVSLLGLHYDEKHFADPHRFNPDRFLGSNKDNITKYTYMPFGEGPRICLGMRFALIQAKVLLAKLVSNFEMRLNKKTKIPIEFDPEGFLLTPVGGIWIDYYKRKSES